MARAPRETCTRATTGVPALATVLVAALACVWAAGAGAQIVATPADNGNVTSAFWGSIQSRASELTGEAAVTWQSVTAQMVATTQAAQAVVEEVARLFAPANATLIRTVFGGAVAQCTVPFVTLLTSSKTPLFDYACCHMRVLAPPGLGGLASAAVVALRGPAYDTTGGAAPAAALSRHIRSLRSLDTLASFARPCPSDTSVYDPEVAVVRGRAAAALCAEIAAAYRLVHSAARTAAACLNATVESTRCLANTTLVLPPAPSLFYFDDGVTTPIYTDVCGPVHAAEYAAMPALACATAFVLDDSQIVLT